MPRCLLGRFADDRHFQTAADRFRDVTHRHTLFGDRVIPGSRGAFSSVSL